MKTYLELGQRLVDKYHRRHFGKDDFRQDRTNTGTVSIFGPQVSFDLSKGFPLLTTKLVPMRLVIAELIWFLTGDTNANTLIEQNVHIWDEWAIETGELGPVYGAQWRSWANPKATEVHVYSAMERFRLAEDLLKSGIEVPFSAQQLGHIQRGYGLFDEVAPLEERAADVSIIKLVHRQFNKWGIPRERVTENPVDQLAQLIHNLKHKPYSRRHIISAWNVADLPDESMSPQDNVRAGKMALAPCHTMFQFYVEDLTPEERVTEAKKMGFKGYEHDIDFAYELMEQMDRDGVPRQRLDCKLYQR